MQDIGIEILNGMLQGLLSSALGAIDFAVDNFINIAFYAEKEFETQVGVNFTGIFNTVKNFAIYLIILKFVKKGFDVYVLWTDGDSEIDPIILLTNFIKCITVAVSFEFLYELLTGISMDFINAILGNISSAPFTEVNTIANALTNLFAAGLFIVIFILVYIVMYLLLWFQFIKRGLELLTLRAAMPLACVGLLDSDGGVFKPYLKKIFQTVFSVILQVIFFKLSVVFLLENHLFFAIGSMGMALKTPEFLSEFIAVSNNSGLQKASTAMYTVSMIKNFAR